MVSSKPCGLVPQSITKGKIREAFALEMLGQLALSGCVLSSQSYYHFKPCNKSFVFRIFILCCFSKCLSSDHMMESHMPKAAEIKTTSSESICPMIFFALFQLFSIFSFGTNLIYLNKPAMTLAYSSSASPHFYRM